MAAENSPAVKKNFSGIRALGLVLIVLILVPLAYGLFYFQNRSAYLTNHYFRSLSGIEKQINTGINGMAFLLRFALTDKNQKVKDTICKDNDYCQKYTNYLKKHSTTFQNLTFDNKITPCIYPIENTGKLQTAPIAKKCFSISGLFDNKKIIVFDQTTRLTDEEKNTLTPEGEKELKEGKVLTTELPIKDLIDPTIALKFFNRILLLDQAGNIIYRSGSDNLLKTNNFTARDDFVRFENLNHYLHSGVTKEIDFVNQEYKTEEVDQITSHSRVREVTIADISYLLYIQPFSPSLEQYTDQYSNSTQSSKNQKVSSSQLKKLATLSELFPQIKILWKKFHYL